MSVMNGCPNYRKHGGMKMRNKIIESIIDTVVDESTYSEDFKSTFKRFIKNKFDDNAQENDLKHILSLLDDDELKEIDSQ